MRFYKIFNNQSGFTFLEFLIVIFIIGLLAAIIFFLSVNYRKKARDAQRKSDIDQIRTALEFYADDNHNTFPANLAATSSKTDWPNLDILHPYLSPVPKDPINNCNAVHSGQCDINESNYYIRSHTSCYILIAGLETLSGNGGDYPLTSIGANCQPPGYPGIANQNRLYILEYHI